MSISIGMIYGLIAMLGWGLADFLAAISARKVGNYRTLFWSQIIGFLFIISYFFITNHNFDLGNLIFVLILIAFLEVIAYLFFYKGLSEGLVSVVSPIASSFSVVAIILSVIILKDTLNKLQVLGIAIISIGIVMIV